MLLLYQKIIKSRIMNQKPLGSSGNQAVFFSEKFV